MSTCAHHPDRPAHALCMSCGKALCQECATLWDGIHYCAGCLAARRRVSPSRRPWPGWVAVLLASAGLLWVATRLMVWAGILAVEVL